MLEIVLCSSKPGMVILPAKLPDGNTIVVIQHNVALA